MDLNGDKYSHGHQPQAVAVTDSYDQLTEYVEFKVDFHHVYIRARKDPVNKWNELPYLTTENVIFTVPESWPLVWRVLAISVTETENFVAQ